MKVYSVGPNAIMLQFSEVFSEKVANHVSSFSAGLVEESPYWLVDMVPSYITLLLYHQNIDQLQLIAQLRSWLSENSKSIQSTVVNNNPKEIVEIPVCYHKSLAEDLEETAALLKLSVEQLVELHSEQNYRAYALGFQPGFAFLGSLTKELVLPRLSTPRARVPEGSVAIAEQQTAVYPAETPGGWRILGRTPVAMFLPDQDPPVRIQANQFVKFRPIDLTEYNEILEQTQLTKVDNE